MYKCKLLSKVLALFVLVTSLANPVPTFSMEASPLEITDQSIVQSTVSEEVYSSTAAISGEESPAPTLTPTPTELLTPTGDIYGNDFENATLIGKDMDYHGSIEESSDVDYFKFIPEESGVYAFETTGTSNTYGYLYNESKANLAYGADEGIDRNIFITYYLEKGKAYYLRLHSYNILVPYSLRVSKFEDDHGNDTASATFVQIGDITSGEINYANDYDYFKFTPSVSGPYVIESTGTTDITGTLHNITTAYNISDEDKNFRIVQALNANQTYYVYVYHANHGDKDSAGTGSYNIRISAGTDDHGNTFESATTLEIGTEMGAVCESAGDYDYFKFTTETSGMYTIESLGTADTTGFIYNSAKGRLAYDYNYGTGANFYMALWLNAGETYYIEATSSKINDIYKVIVNLMEDDHGYDNNSATELSLNTEVSGEINFTNDYDYFKFTPESTGPYVIESTGSTDISGTLYNITSNSDISTTNQNFRITYTLTANQTYYIHVYHDSYWDKDYDNTGAYGIKVTQLSDDHGNDYDTATEVKVGEETQAVQESSGDYDYFEFTVEEAGMYGIETIGTTDTTGFIYDSAKNHIAYDYNYGMGNNFYFAVWLNVGETYYIQAYSAAINDTYKVKVSALEDDHGYDNNSATELVLDAEVSGEINFTNDTDYFKFTPESTGPYVIESTGSTDVSGTLYNITSSSDISSTNQNFRITYTLTANQTYYIHVYHDSYWDKDYDNTGAYGIKVTQLSDDHGNDYDTATEVKVGEETQAVQESSGDYDYFKFTVEEAGMYGVETIGTTDTTGFIFDSAKKRIAYDYNYGKGYNFYCALWLNAGETYYVQSYSSVINDTYKLKVSALEDDHGYDNNTATELVLDSETAGQINFTNDTDYFKFTPVVSGPYSIESTGLTDVDAYLYNYVYGYNISASNTNFKITYTLNAGQTYYLQVYHNNRYDKDYSNTGAYKIKLTKLSDDHGNSFDTATEIKADKQIQAVQESDGDYDYFKFVPTASGMYCFESLGSVDSTAELYNESKGYVTRDYNSGIGNNFYIPAYLEADKAYYIRAWSKTKDVPYKIKVYALEDDHGYDNNTATQLSVGEEVSGKIGFTRDFDYFKITTDEAGPYMIESTGNTDIYGYLVNYISSNDISADNKNFRIAYKLSANSTYYLQVYHNNYSDKDYQNTGEYTIKLTRLTDKFGDSFDTATQIDTQKLIWSGIEATNDIDFVKFVAPSTATYTIESFGGQNIYGYLYNDAKTYIAYDDNSAGDGRNFRIVYSLEEGKTYYLRINDQYSGYGDYGIAVYQGTDDHNNEINRATAIQIGVESAGKFDYTGDIDYFRFSPSSDGVYQIRSYGNNDTYCEIYDSIGNMLGSSDNIDDNDKNFSITQSLPANRTCYVKVYHTDAEKGLGEYTIKVINTGESAGDDHGNSFDTASLVEIGTEYECRIDYALDIDFVKFVPDSSGTYLIESTGNNNLIGYLYGENKALIASDNNSGLDTNYYIVAMLESGKTYYIKSIHSTGSATGDYGIKITATADDHGNKNSSASVLDVEDSVESSIEYKCDVDVFSFSPEISGAYVFGVLNNADVRVTIYNQSGVSIYTDSRTGSDIEDLLLPIMLSAGEKYYIKVTHKNYSDCDNAGTGTYTMSLSKGTDDHGNSFADATIATVNEVIYGSIESMGDIDMYKFTAQADAIYTISTLGSTNTFGYLYDDKQLLRMSDDNSGDGDNFYFSSTLIAGKVYYIKVVHASTTGTGDYRLAIASDNVPPTAPAYLTVTSKAAGTVGLQWTASTDNVSVLGYNIYRDGVKVGSSTSLNYTDTVTLQGLYNYTVRAYDVSGNESSDSSIAVFDYQKPSKPEDLKVDEKTVKSVKLTWNVSQDYEGLGVQGYYVYRDGVRVKTIIDNTYTDTELEPDTTYKFSVAAFDKAGNESEASDYVTIVTDIDNEAPSVPQGIKIASKTGSSITVAWNASTDNYKVEGYRIFRNGAELANTDSLFYQDIELTETTSYSYTVLAYDKFGNESDLSTEVSAIPLKPHIIRVEPVEGITIGGNTYQQFRVYFANNNNLIGMKAKLELKLGDASWEQSSLTLYGPYNLNNSTAYFYTNLYLDELTGGSYNFRYTITDADGNEDSLEAVYFVDNTSPSVPQNIQAVGLTGKINISWDKPEDADVAGYIIMRSTTADFETSNGILIGGAENNFYDDVNVEYGTAYYYKVLAFDSFNQKSDYSSVVLASPVVDDVVPVVLGIEPFDKALIGPNTNITVRAEDNIAVQRIKLQYSLDGKEWTDIATKNTSAAATFNWNPSPINGDVFVRAIAIDKSGLESDGTPVRNFKADTVGPEKVTGLSYVAHTTYVVLKWSDVADQDFLYFMVEQKDGDGTYKNVGTTSTTLGMNVTGLVPDSTYVYRVVAYDRFGNRGVTSEDLTVSTTVDETAPWITGIGPAPSYFGTTLSLWANARDNASIAAVKFEMSKDLTNWNDIAEVTNSVYSSSFTARYDYDVSELVEGKIYVRAVAFDASGLSSPTEGNYAYAEYIIDHSGPSAPEGLTIEPGAGNITLKWKQGSELDLYTYRVYKSETGIEPFELLADSVASVGYIDRSVEQDKTYYYKVSAVDVAGNEGQLCDAVSGMVLADDEAPVVYSISPIDNSTLPKNPKISVMAGDNYRLKHISVEYKAYGDVSDSWSKVYEQDLTEYSEVVTFTFNTAELAEGKYSFRAVATDTSGNVSESKTVTYDFNLVAPAKPVVTATAAGWRAELSWDKSEEADLAGYRIYRSLTSADGYKLIKEQTENKYTDEGLIPGVAYYYVVEAIDIYRNSERSSEVVVIPNDEDDEAPVAQAGDDHIIATGVAVLFDATRSKDNNRISSYLWDFGDGETSSQAQPSHIYTQEGEYIVTLIVKDPAGNEDSDTLIVTVKAPQQVGTIEIKVVDDSSGAVIGGSSVVVEYADGTMDKYTTNGAGVLNVSVPKGEYKIYAYKTDYKPDFTGVSIEANTKTPVTIKLQKGQLVIGELTVKRMTLDEIVDAGIDITAPENQWVYKFEVHLAFQNRPLPKQEFIVNGTGSVINYSPLYIPSGSGGYGALIAYPVAIPVPNHPEVRPTVAYMVIPGEARFLKEFFEVGLTLENTADPVFVIEQSKAELKLPEGLTFIATEDSKSLKVDIGDFKGGETKEIKWIIRGDKKGEYIIEADFGGVLQPFGEKVSASFKNEEPFRVWGDDALKMHVYAQDKADEGYPYKVRFELHNVSDIPVYYPAIELLEEGKQNYFYAPNQELVKSLVELPAGEKLIKEYTLVSAITGDLDLSRSYVLRTGGNAEISSVIHKISVPENNVGTAPVIIEKQNADGTVTLTWGAVQNAKGYKIYKIRKDLNMSVDPDELIAGVDASTTTYTVKESGASYEYIVTTLLEEGEILRHAIQKWPYGEDPAPAVVTVDPEVLYMGRSTEIWVTSNKGGFPVAGGIVKVDGKTAVLDSNGQAKIIINPNALGEIDVKIFDSEGVYLVSKSIKVIPVIPEGELLKNPSFSLDTKGWSLWTEGGASATGTRDTAVFDTAPGGYRIDCTAKGTAANHIQIYTGGISVEAGKKYRLTFMAKSEGGKVIPRVEISKYGTPWTSYASARTAEIGSDWKKHSMIFVSKTTDSNARITFFLGDRIADGGKLYIDSLSLVEDNDPEILDNPSFDSDINGWWLWTEGSASAIGQRDTETYETEPAGYRIDCISKGSAKNQIQLIVTGLSIKSGKSYKLEFMAKSVDGDIKSIIQLMQRKSPWTLYANTSIVDIGSEWKLYTVYFKTNTTDNDARITYFLGEGMSDGSKLYIDSLSLTEVD